MVDAVSGVRVVVGTYGDPRWVALAADAVRSAAAQTVPCEVVHVHADTLAKARNIGAAAPGVDWLVFLDADDQLEERYVEAMLAGEGDLRQPSTRGVYADGTVEEPPSMIPPRSLIEGNFLIIGTMVGYDLFHAAGGFREMPIYEDWELWVRCRLRRASIGQVPAAVYRITVNEGSRNMQDRRMQLDWYQKIRMEHSAAARQLRSEGFVI